MAHSWAWWVRQRQFRGGGDPARRQHRWGDHERALRHARLPVEVAYPGQFVDGDQAVDAERRHGCDVANAEWLISQTPIRDHCWNRKSLRRQEAAIPATEDGNLYAVRDGSEREDGGMAEGRPDSVTGGHRRLISEFRPSGFEPVCQTHDEITERAPW